MPAYRYDGEHVVYVPDLGRMIEPGEVVQFEADPMHGLFAPVNESQED